MQCCWRPAIFKDHHSKPIGQRLVKARAQPLLVCHGSGLTSRDQAKENEGRKLSDLYEVSKYSHVTIHDYIRRLMAADIIAKASFDGDGRRVSYMLTDKAGKVLDDLYRQIEGLT